MSHNLTVKPQVQYSGTTAVSALAISSGTVVGNPIDVAVNSSGVIAGDSAGLFSTSKLALQFIWTGTPSGTLSVEASLDFVPQGQLSGNGNWTTLPVSPFTQPAGASGSALVTITDIVSPWIRWRYTPAASGSSGTLSAWAAQKMF